MRRPDLQRIRVPQQDPQDDGRRETDHRDPVEYALDEDGGERGRLAYSFAQAQHVRTYKLADTRREHVIRHVADDFDFERAPECDLRKEGLKQNAPADCTHPYSDEIE